jgi:hypothetical protein
MSQITLTAGLCNAPELTAASSLKRHEWLESAAEALRARFATAGYAVPDKVRVSIGWPRKASSCGAVGECWPATASSDAYIEQFIAPSLVDGVEIVGVLAHELVHATVGNKAGHGPPFKQCALTIGLAGPMRATTPGPEFVAWTGELFKRIGPYPAGYLTTPLASPKQTTRLIKCACACGYVARVARSWLDAAGPPICPADLVPMAIDMGDAQ